MSSTETLNIDQKKAQPPCRSCSDHDEDCHDIQDKVVCWLYDPQRGMCPYLSSATKEPKP